MTNVVVEASITALRALTTNPDVIWLEGYATAADGGEGMFVYVASDTSSIDNNGTIIVTAGGARYYREYNKEALNICWFGAYLNSSTDSTAAINYALAALPSAGGTVYFPAGTFTFESAIVYTVPSSSSPFSLSIVGDGADVSVLYWPTTNAINIKCTQATHSVHFRDLTISTGQSCKHNGIEIDQSDYGYPCFASDFVRVNFRGQTALAQYWATGITINGLSNVNYDTLLIYGGSASGTGVSIDDTGTNDFSVVHNLSRCTFYNGQIGLLYASNVQGVTVSQCNFTNITTGIMVPDNADGGYQLAVIGSQFGCLQYGIDIEGNMAALSVSSSLFLMNSTSTTNNPGIYINHFLNMVSIVGNQFAGAGTEPPYGTGIQVTAGSGTNAFYGVVSGNCFQSLAVGVDLTGAYQWNVQANSYGIGSNDTVTTPVIPGSGNYVGIATK